MIRLPNEVNHDMDPTNKSHHKPPSTTGSPPATTKFAAVAGARPRAQRASACGAAKAYAMEASKAAAGLPAHNAPKMPPASAATGPKSPPA